MRASSLIFVLLAAGSSAVFACGGTDRSPFAAPTTTDSGTSSPTAGGDDDDDAGSTSKPKDAAAGEDVQTPATVDPEKRGPFTTAEKTGKQGGIAMHAFYPKDQADKVPVVLFAHGFQIEPSQYDSRLKHLASYGYVAITADFEASFGGNPDNDTQAEQILSALDWAKGDATVGPHADVDHVGTSGHSLGGKLALLAATKDPRVKASIVLDPVDGNGVTVADLLPDLDIPTAFLGETLDATAGGLGQACAPKASNYQTFYAKAKAPSLEVTIDGASHMSFLDDIASCPTCTFCKSATTPVDDVATITKGFMVAFYERRLRGRTEYDAYLAKSTDLVEIRSK